MLVLLVLGLKRPMAGTYVLHFAALLPLVWSGGPPGGPVHDGKPSKKGAWVHDTFDD